MKGTPLAVIVTALLWGAGPAQASMRCDTVDVPVDVNGAPGARIHGELCRPSGPPPQTVQLLVHGGTYTHDYWDWSQDPGRYSYVRAAVRAGYATFNVDRLGVGASTRPLSALVSTASGASALHQVIGRLRTGAIGGRAFARVVWVGHSLGSVYAWVEGSMHRDVDAFVLTGMTHVMKPSFLAAGATRFYSAALDPKFAGLGLDPGYQTTVPGARGEAFYYLPTADPNVIALDEQLKDTVTELEGLDIVAMALSPPPALAPSRRIRVPTLLVLGEHDGSVCGPPDGIACTRANVLAAEAPYYAPSARLDARVVPATGHDLQLHLTAPQASRATLDWLAHTVAP